jgi:epoxyqueuosine reductase
MKKLLRAMGKRGYRSRAVHIGRLRKLVDEINAGYDQGLLVEDLHQRYFSAFDSEPPAGLADPRSLIVVAYADPPVRFTFSREGKNTPVMVPPTYLNAEVKDAAVEAVLKQLLAPEGYRAARIAVPKKLLAVCSGLARYGRNNIAYVEGLGSYHRLAVFCSDAPCGEDGWTAPRMLERCEDCRVCQRSCPTGAIGSDRFLLHAERCLTLWNEKPGDVAFPDWVEASWHNCLVGCMECQRACPENGALKGWCEEGVEFSEDETELVMAGVEPAKMPAPLVEKMRRWDLLALYEELPRNLHAYLVRNS